MSRTYRLPTEQFEEFHFWAVQNGLCYNLNYSEPEDCWYVGVMSPAPIENHYEKRVYSLRDFISNWEEKQNTMMSDSDKTPVTKTPMFVDQPRVKWEYMVGCETDLAWLGKEGWELVAIVGGDSHTGDFYFKRPKL